MGRLRDKLLCDKRRLPTTAASHQMELPNYARLAYRGFIPWMRHPSFWLFLLSHLGSRSRRFCSASPAIRFPAHMGSGMAPRSTLGHVALHSDVHVPTNGHVAVHGTHASSSDEGLSPFNMVTFLAFFTWFGGIGYVLTAYLGVLAILAVL